MNTVLEQQLQDQQKAVKEARRALAFTLFRGGGTEPYDKRLELDAAEASLRDIEVKIEFLAEFEAQSKAEGNALEQRRRKNEAEREALIEQWSVHPKTDDVDEAKQLFTRDYPAMKRTVAADRRAYALLQMVRNKGVRETDMRNFLKQHNGIFRCKQILAGSWKP